MEFQDVFDRHAWEDFRAAVHGKKAADVEAALHRDGQRDLNDFCALVSPAAGPYLEEMAWLSRRITRRRFGNTIQLYIPIYLSNLCQNHCIYCGFNAGNELDRVVLSEEEILAEIEVVKSYGFDHVLLVTGEHHRRAGYDYLRRALEMVRPHFSHISLEVQPLAEQEYAELSALGLNTIYIYQETYNRERYGVYHPRGRKSDFAYRLQTADRLGRAGIHKIGLGCLLGLEDWRVDACFLALHLQYLDRLYWRTKYSISFPRLRPAAGGFQPAHPVSDRELVQLICAYRLLDENVELSLSTRESAAFRDGALKVGITQLSAGSRTEPGGYVAHGEALEQFAVHDFRNPAEVAAVIRAQGYEPVWKDWDHNLGVG